MFHILLIGETPSNFDIIIENDNLEEAYQILRNFVMSNYNPHCHTGELNVSRFFWY